MIIGLTHAYLSALLFCSVLVTSFKLIARNETSLNRGDWLINTDTALVKRHHKEYKFSWLRTDTSIALKNYDWIVWQFNYNKQYDKPYFYPLQTAKGGFGLAWNRPADHPWHRGLWFSWKTINSVNYWEEDFTTRLSEGRTRIKLVDVKLNKDYSAVINLKLTYGPGNKAEVLTESRSLLVTAPDSKGNYYIDWALRFMAANEPVIFDRTPPQKLGGPYYGGYAGLSLRAAESMKKHSYVDAKGWKGTAEVVGYGTSAEWMDLSGAIDSSAGAYGGVSMFNHPSNIHSPTPWYVYKDKQFAFYNAAILFEKPIKLAPSEKMQLLYRVLVHSDTLSTAALSGEYSRFIQKYPRNQLAKN